MSKYSIEDRERWLKQSAKITDLRKKMGIRQVTLANLFKCNQGNFSKMEQGFYCNDEVYSYLTREFAKWKASKIICLKKEIKFWESYL